MTVHELVALLEMLPQDRQVILAGDSEGNSYSPLAGVWKGNYAADTTWSGTMGLEVLTEEDRAAGYTDADLGIGVPAVVLCPIN